MSIKIYHGAPGSYKTSGAVANDFISAAKSGRKVITNIRGLDDIDNVIDVLDKKGIQVHPDFCLENIDTESSEGMDKIRKFYHWADDGIFFFLDEIQEIYPKSFTDKKLLEFDYPHGRDQAKADNRLETLSLAFEKHRHHNWDFVVTSPNIAKVHKVVREAAETAYKHRNLATIGIKGRYVEASHAADTNGRKTDFYSVTNKKIPKYVFELYSSTATGKVQDTTSGQSLFKDPKLLFLLLVLFGSFYFANFGSGDSILYKDAETDSHDSTQTIKKPSESTVQNPVLHTQENSAIHSDSMANIQPVLSRQISKNPFEGHSYSIISVSSTSYKIKVNHTESGGYYFLTKSLAKVLNYKTKQLSNCLIQIRHSTHKTYAYCIEPQMNKGLISMPMQSNQ